MNDCFDVKIKYLNDKCHLKRQTGQAACYDAVSAADKIVYTQSIALVPLGFCLELPVNMEAQIRGRSGFTKRGLVVQLGTIDSDYRGEVHAIVHNTTNVPFEIMEGNRIAQIAFNVIPRINLIPRFELTPTERGSNGFGSTGEK